jgi:hypothetical protein
LHGLLVVLMMVAGSTSETRRLENLKSHIPDTVGTAETRLIPI